jgi:adenylosuccinate synthase
MNATIITDLGLGDAGKGSVCDAETRKHSGPVVIVRYNGGGQAAHNVHTPEGQHHTFAQFGSGTFVPGTMTFHSKFFLLDPFSLVNEAEALEKAGCASPRSRLFVDERALVVTPYHKSANRVREFLRGAGRHGTCGMGIGETMADSEQTADPLRVGDLRDLAKVKAKMSSVKDRKWEEFGQHADALVGTVVESDIKLIADPDGPEIFSEPFTLVAKTFRIVDDGMLRALADKYPLIFEGAQGVLLDQDYGFHPHTTWSTTTTANALEILRDIGYDKPVNRLGLLRAYATRHGSGPFPTEDAELTRLLPDPHNRFGEWQREFRVGWFDMVLARYAIAVCDGLDGLVITNVDRFDAVPGKKVCVRYDDGNQFFASIRPNKDWAQKPVLSDLLSKVKTGYSPVFDSDGLLELIEEMTGISVVMTSHGPTHLDKKPRRGMYVRSH